VNRIRVQLTSASALFATLLLAASAFAEWTYEKHPMGPGYVIKHSDGQVLNTTYKSEKAAKKATKALNDAEKKADRNDK